MRPPAVAGRFYPADPEQLSDLVDRLLGEVRGRPQPVPPAALVVPHAGYRYAGAVAATAYAQLTTASPDAVPRVVLLGPAHFWPLDGMAVPAVDGFATPLGTVRVDDDARTAAAALPGVVVDDRPHDGEHSLQTHLPFLQRILGPEVAVLPVLVGRTRPESVAAVLLALDGALAVVSTDLSHHLDERSARERDRRTADAVLARDAGALRPDDACGHHPLRGLLHHAAERDLTVELLRLATSADSGTGRARVVGYGAFLLHGAAGGRSS
ncbi:AmmeMemoRadiSam system protein B [Geodermatophilus chilensis]|uniref:AmmeMemoRadiSam system protein B n=1 Tax=Geodermatophilus chilensis TaxID=2035835 RepID=UPI000C267F7C|nr:AmmeMemoRadiSam system protein B [Geodermatophilus chilensis]